MFRVAIESRSHKLGYFENAKSGKEDESHIREGVRGGRIILTLGRNCMMYAHAHMDAPCNLKQGN